MDGHCILCDQAISATAISTALVPIQSNVLCAPCRALSPEVRHVLRERAMVRMLRSDGKDRRRAISPR
jgi:hypothetical protein